MRTLKYRGGTDISLMRETKAKLIDIIFDHDRRLSLFANHKDSMRDATKRMREMVRNYAKYKVYEQAAAPEGEEHTYVTQEIWDTKLIELANAKKEISQLNGQVMQLVDEREDARRTIEERNATLKSFRDDITALEVSNIALKDAIVKTESKLIDTTVLANTTCILKLKKEADRFHTWHTRIFASFWGKVFILFNSDLLATKEHDETIPARDV